MAAGDLINVTPRGTQIGYRSRGRIIDWFTQRRLNRRARRLEKALPEDG
jgi:hypothetical protein